MFPGWSVHAEGSEQPPHLQQDVLPQTQQHTNVYSWAHVSNADSDEAPAKRSHAEPDRTVELEPVIDDPASVVENSVRATQGDAATATQSADVVTLQQQTVYPSEGILSTTKFESLKICDKVSRAVKSMGHEYLTHIQDAAIPQLLKGHDLLGSARTGTAFLLLHLFAASQSSRIQDSSVFFCSRLCRYSPLSHVACT